MGIPAPLLAALLIAAVCGQARAQDYPVRPITLLVGLAAGGVSDVMARIYAEAVSKRLGQKVIVENRAAASGAVAAASLQNAQPDGYTLLIFSAAQHTTIPAIEGSAIYDPVKGNQPITLLFNIATVVAVPTGSPVNSFAELTASGKKKPEGLTFGSPGLGTPSHLIGAKLMLATGTPAQYVHYRGGAPMMSDLLPGRLDVAVLSTPLARAFLVDKKLKALAADAPERWSVIPDVPTLRELGLEQATVAGWFGVAAPPDTPRPIVDKLHAAFTDAARDPDVTQKTNDNGLAIATSKPEEMRLLLIREAAENAQLVRTLGLGKP
jgi:tripartite-type tricarboxylate transporter receptor subunit TctC